MKNIGFLSFGHWTDHPESGTRSASDALLQAIDLAVAAEIVSDAQLTRFRRDPDNKGGVMDRGLWRYSRHPNYFFQTLTWVAYALIALPAQYGWFAFLPAAAILYLVLFVTGLPAAEESSLRTRGDAYRAYQAHTSAFVPWFPKR